MNNIILNPILISITVLYVLCLKKFNILIALIIASLVAGVCSGVPLVATVKLFINGIGDNGEAMVSYILLGTLAAVMTRTGFSASFAHKITKFIKGEKLLLFLTLTILAIIATSILPIHIAFIPMVVPPLIPLMNKLSIDRRAVACALSFGLVAPYIAIPVGFGLMFQKLVLDNLHKNGVDTTYEATWHCFAILGIALVVGWLFSLFVSYRKPRTYEDKSLNITTEKTNQLTRGQNTVLICSLVGTFAIQLITHSLLLGGMFGLVLLLVFRVINLKHLDLSVNDSILNMGFIAIVMLAAAGFANVLKETHSTDRLINDLLPLLPHTKTISTILILIIGLIITLGTGSAFGTIPIVSAIFVPLCVQLNYSPQEIVILVASAAALGDAGAPVSESALAPTAGLNIDGQHDHIWDTCVPSFWHCNIPLFISTLFAIMFGWV